MTSAPKFIESQALPDVDYAGFAASLGLNASTITDPGELGGAWEKALSADRPTVLDVHVDPNMPPIPPHANWEQFKSATTAVLKGDEDSWGFIKTGLKTKAQEFVPHKNS